MLGIIGTLLGTLLGFFLNLWREKKGKINFFINQPTLRYADDKQMGDLTVDKERATVAHLSFGLDIYNTMDSPQILRNIKLSLYNNEGANILAVTPLNDNDIWQDNLRYVHKNKLEVINLLPKQIVHLDISADIQEVNKVVESQYIYLEAESPKKGHIKEPIPKLKS